MKKLKEIINSTSSLPSSTNDVQIENQFTEKPIAQEPVYGRSPLLPFVEAYQKMQEYSTGVRQLSESLAGKFRHGTTEDHPDTRRIWMDFNPNPINWAIDFSSEGTPDNLKGVASVRMEYKPEFLSDIPDSHGDVHKPGWLKIPDEAMEDIPTLREIINHYPTQASLYSRIMEMRDLVDNKQIYFKKPDNRILKELEEYVYSTPPINFEELAQESKRAIQNLLFVIHNSMENDLDEQDRKMIGQAKEVLVKLKKLK